MAEDANKDLVEETLKAPMTDADLPKVTMTKTASMGQSTALRVFTIAEQPDGNWKGHTFRYGTRLDVRDYDPQVVLQALITHP